MAIPIAAKKNIEQKPTDSLGLYFPLLTTSPALPQAGDTYLSDVRLKDISAKAIYMEKGLMEPNPSWDGEKYDWSSGVTEIQTNFIDGGDSTSGNFNLLFNTGLTGGQKDYWTSVYDKPYEDNSTAREQIYNWSFSPTPPSDLGKIWVDTSDMSFEPKYWNASKWESYYDFQKNNLGGEVKIVESDIGSIYDFNIEKKAKNNNIIGVSQFAELQIPLWNGDFLTAGLDLWEEPKSQGVVMRVEFFDANKQYIKTAFSPRYFNAIQEKQKKHFSYSFLYDDRTRMCKYVRATFYGAEDRNVSAFFNKTKIEYGKKDTGWNLHEEEVLLDLNAGQIKVPMLNGVVDKTKLISEIAVLRSVLGEGLLKWEEVTRLKASSFQEAVLHDYFVENGNYYRYALQPILASGMKGAITSFYDVVTTFDGFWLLGEEDHQFSFIYNGKIGEINHVKPTEIIETIAGQYPYVVTPSDLNYRTYTFSGMLTYQQDALKLFTSDKYSVAISPEPTIPVSTVELKYGDEQLINMKNDLEEGQDGMVMQRLWRKKILAWLKDGKPKILKSEAQGNMLVVLSKVTETPNEPTFGLISEFSCTVTEIGALDEKALQKYKLRKSSITKDELIKETLKENNAL